VKPHQNPDMLRLIGTGPFFLLILVGTLAAFSLIAMALGRFGNLVNVTRRAAERLERSRLFPTLWGLSATVLLFVIAVVLFKTKVLGLLGLVVLVSGLILVSIGSGVNALRVGRQIAFQIGRGDEDDLSLLKIGMGVLFVTASIPIVGWIIAILETAAGIGAVLETLLNRSR
jgi:hypothetical protein